MSERQEHQDENRTDGRTEAPMGIPDEALPEDLVAGEDNPLAEGLPPGETAEGLLDSEDEEGGAQTGSAPQEQ